MPTFRDIPLALCHGCGTCVAACPRGALAMEGVTPRLTGTCDACGVCHDICPGIAVDFERMALRTAPGSIPDVYFGPYESMHLARARDAGAAQSSSGGAVTAMLVHALRRGLIRAAVVVDMDPSSPHVSRALVARTEDQILSAAGSKYSLVPVMSVLSILRDVQGPAALVGLPCHIHGLRRLQEAGHPAGNLVSCAVGIFCGLNLLPEAAVFLLRKMGVSPREVRRMRYRAGEWPGGFFAETAGGRTHFIPKAAFNFLHAFFLPPRCALCPDLFAEGADIAAGDYWPSGGGEGRSSVIVRNEKGRALLEAAAGSGALALEPLTPGMLYRSHAHLISYKKRSVHVRLAHARPRPRYTIRKPLPRAGDAVRAAPFALMLRAGRTRFGRFIARLLPLSITGALARGARRAGSAASRRQSRRYWTLAEVGAHWDRTDDYDELNLKTYSYARRFIDGFALAAPFIPRGGEVLDISCRTGQGALYFGSRIPIRLTGMAPSPLQLGRARETLARAGIPFAALEWKEMRLPLADESFDFALSFETIEHVFACGDFLAELHRVLKPGGGLLLTTPNLLWDPVHTLAAWLRLHHSEGPHRFLPRRELRGSIARAGFRIRAEVSTVLIPYGPRWLTSAGRRIEQALPERVRRVLCLRRVILCTRVAPPDEGGRAP